MFSEVVFSRHQVSSDVPVAVKTMKEDSSDADRVSFLREAAVMGQLSHRNIVELLAVVLDEDEVSERRHVMFVDKTKTTVVLACVILACCITEFGILSFVEVSQVCVVVELSHTCVVVRESRAHVVVGGCRACVVARGS